MVEELQHSELSPSQSNKWLYCPAYRRRKAAMQSDDRSSPAAEEGTLAHSFLEIALNNLKEHGHTGDWEVDCSDDMTDNLNSVIQYILAVYDDMGPDAEIYAEQKLDYGDQFGYMELFGTADVIVLNKNTIYVGDLKYGFGQVGVNGNTQLLIYLSGAVAKYGPRPYYTIGVLQPRGNNIDGPIRKVSVTHTELVEFNVKLFEGIAKSYSNKPGCVGSHCHNWCQVLPVCEDVANHAITLFKKMEVD